MAHVGWVTSLWLHPGLHKGCYDGLLHVE